MDCILHLISKYPEDFALCEFVDTSKIELQKIVRDGLNLLYKEMN